MKTRLLDLERKTISNIIPTHTNDWTLNAGYIVVTFYDHNNGRVIQLSNELCFHVKHEMRESIDTLRYASLPDEP